MTQAPGNPQKGPFSPRRPEGPRKVRHGVKLKGILHSQAHGQNVAAVKGQIADMPSAAIQLAQRFLELIQSHIEPAQVAAGLEYAKAGQIVSLDFQPGVVDAKVQGTAAKPYGTQIRVPRFTNEQWSRVIEAMSSEAVHVAKLLAGELPPTIDELLSGLQLSLLPASMPERSAHCTCDETAYCKHVAAAAQVAAERLAEQPLLIFTLLGKPSEQLLEQLRQARTLQTHGVASAHTEAQIPESQTQAMPLEACIDEFWRSPLRNSEWEELENRPASQHVPHALLRRLGPSPMNGRFPLVGLLASVYDTVTAAAKRLSDDEDGPTTQTARAE